MLSNRGVGEDSWESLGLQGDQISQNKGNQTWIFMGRTDAEAEAPILCHLMGRANSLEQTLILEKIEGRRRRGRQRLRWLDGPLLFLPSIFPSIGVFSNELVLVSDGQSVEALASVLPMNIQSWFPLGLTDLISLQSKGLLRVFSSLSLWTVACQTPPSMGFSGQECWSGWPFLSPGDLPGPGIGPRPPTLQADSLPIKLGI